MFRFDKNDATVRLDSQLGGIPLKSKAATYVDIETEKDPDIIESVLHSYTQRYPKIQRHVVDLLKNGIFAESLPEAGQFMAGKKPVVDGIDWQLTDSFAKKWSGLVFSHADAIQEVTMREKVIIITRPVNPDSTPLIRSGEATKGMNVKGKSSNWGPQKGYIPADQTYSKLWGKPVKEIEKYAKKTSEMLRGKELGLKQYLITAEQLEAYTPPGDMMKVGESIAIRKPLGHRIGGDLYTVWARPGTNQESGAAMEWITDEDARAWLFLCKEATNGERIQSACECPQWFDWRTNGEKFDKTRKPKKEVRLPDEVCSRLKPLDVLADNAHPEEKYLTADYDLLAFGFFCPADGQKQDACAGFVKESLGPDKSCGNTTRTVTAFQNLWSPPDPFPCFDIHKGLITEAQKDVLMKLNEAVKGVGYTGGNVSHHGPETNFNESPYVDYPIIVFDPGVPDSSNTIVPNTAKIIAIPQGPKGFRDLHLKRYFERKIRQGFWVYPNTYITANWFWNNRFVNEMWVGWEQEDDRLVPQGKSAKQLTPPPCVQDEIDRLGLGENPRNKNKKMECKEEDQQGI